MPKFEHLMDPLAMSISIRLSSSLISDKMSMKSLFSSSKSGKNSARRSCSFHAHCFLCPTECPSTREISMRLSSSSPS
uniref:Uncharacterized protein n=1 Tax=Oryza brachyantha TaxID=4533 RepID=J3NDK5_ORYBR